MSSIKQSHFPHSCASDKDWLFHGGIKIASIIFKLTMSNIFFPVKCTNFEIYHAFKLCFNDWKWRRIFFNTFTEIYADFSLLHIYITDFFLFCDIKFKKKRSRIILLFWATLLSLSSFKQQKTKWNVYLIIPEQK